MDVSQFAADARRQLEHGERVAQRRFRLFHGGLLVGGARLVLEADDVGAGHLKFHRDAVALDGDVQLAVAVLVRPQLAVLLGDGRNTRREDGGDEKIGSAHNTFPSGLDRLTAPH